MVCYHVEGAVGYKEKAVMREYGYSQGFGIPAQFFAMLALMQTILLNLYPRLLGIMRTTCL